MEVTEERTAPQKKAPSLLRQIIDEVDDLDNEKKEALLWRIKMEKAMELSNRADEVFKDRFKTLHDKEIAAIVSANRKSAYNAKHNFFFDLELQWF
jgi:hypothetical protein